jgi:hypothetical protein
VEGLEPTGHAAVQAPPAILPELEPTRHAPAAPADDRTPDIEPTRAPPVDVEVAPAADLERTAAEIPGDAATPLPAVVTCRYCRTPAAPGERLCARCGMRLPGVRTEPPAPAGEAGWRCTCGTLVRGSLCPSCGARPPAH